MSLIKHTIATLGGDPRVVVMPTGTDNDVGYVTAPNLSSIVCPRGQDLVMIYADTTSFIGLKGKDRYDIAIIKTGRITRYGPLFLSTISDQAQRGSEGKQGSKVLTFHRMSNATLRSGAERLGKHHQDTRAAMMKNEPDARRLFRELTGIKH